MGADESMQEAAREWLASCRIISKFLKEIRPDLTQHQLDHNAAAIIARLASNDPPLLIMTMKEE